MPLIFTDFQQSTWLRPTSCWKICEYQSHPLVYRSSCRVNMVVCMLTCLPPFLICNFGSQCHHLKHSKKNYENSVNNKKNMMENTFLHVTIQVTGTFKSVPYWVPASRLWVAITFSWQIAGVPEDERYRSSFCRWGCKVADIEEAANLKRSWSQPVYSRWTR